MILKGREFDRFAQRFLARHPDAVVVHIGCGLDTRFERVDNGRVEWYDLDLPEVIELRRKLVGGEGPRHHFLAGSVLDSAWLDAVSAHKQVSFLFLAEGVFMYFEEVQVKSLVLTLHDRFPGAELVFDGFSPFMAWGHNVRVTRTGVGAYLHWGLKHPRDLEEWSGASSAGVEDEAARELAAGVPGGAGFAVTDWPLARFVALQSLCAAFVCGDTGPVHTSVAAGCPVEVAVDRIFDHRSAQIAARWGAGS